MERTFKWVCAALGIVIVLFLSIQYNAAWVQDLPLPPVHLAGPGWRSLSEGAFVNVNCNPDTWSWKGKLLTCTGQPIGVMRSRQIFTNFELVAEWRHLRSAGNS